MAKKIILATARIMLGILTLKITHNKFQFRTYHPARTCYILKTRIIINKIYTRRLSTATRIHSSN